MDHALQRHNMVEGQIRPNRVTDALLIQAMGDVPREAFVPAEAGGFAYIDEAIPIGGGRYLMEPMVLARLLQAAKVAADDTALVIGCASGYSAAVLARLASAVVALEEDAELAAKATQVLIDLGVDNAAVLEGALAEGCAKQAPYDVILLGGAVNEIPPAIIDQLADGGRLVCVLGAGAGAGQATLVTRHGQSIARGRLFEAGTPPLPGFQAPPDFRF
jgi:protein-L-isoaspartate(D-aspartate) O-methyltransferase